MNLDSWLFGGAVDQPRRLAPLPPAAQSTAPVGGVHGGADLPLPHGLPVAGVAAGAGPVREPGLAAQVVHVGEAVAAGLEGANKVAGGA